MMKTFYGLVLGLLATVGCATNEHEGDWPSPKPPACDATPNGACSCTADTFIACVGDTEVSCNANGDGITTQSCGSAGCNVAAGRCNTCVANEVTCSADGMTVDHCGPDGLIASQDSCAAGCSADGASAHCMNIKPAWLPDACDLPATIASASFINTLDTDNDGTCTGGVVTSNGTTFCVLRARTIDIASLKVTGSRPLAIIADDKLTVSGTLDVSADGTTSGPGASMLNKGESTSSYLGAGGAGFAQIGGMGGASDTGSAGASGSGTQRRRIDEAFVGGSRGGDSVCDFSNTYCFNSIDFSGGGGGGAALLIACRGTVKVTGIVDAGGGGGHGGGDRYPGSGFAPGGAPGGGSGGFVVFEGVRVEITGTLYANGGGGGGGCSGDDCVGNPGTDGAHSMLGAAGGIGQATTNKCTGGAGGSQSTPPYSGWQTYANSAAGAGGGGGSMGAFGIFTPASGSAIIPTSSSPMPEVSTTKLDVH